MEKFKIKLTLYLLLTIFLQLILLPTLCGEKINNIKFLIAITTDILIPLRLLLLKSSDFEKKTYIIVLITSPIWIHVFHSIY